MQTMEKKTFHTFLYSKKNVIFAICKLKIGYEKAQWNATARYCHFIENDNIK